MTTLCTLAGGALKIKLSPLFVVLFESLFGFLHVLLRLLHRFGGFPGHALGCHFHLDHGVFEGWFLCWGRCVAHIRFYIYILIDQIIY